MESTAPQTLPELTEDAVLAFLRKHPGFLAEHPELLEILTPPAEQHGNGVLDFQAFAIDRLKRSVQGMKHRFDHVIDSARDNMSVQSQVHHAVLQVVRARNLEQLLDVITMDIAGLFRVDVVRLSMESTHPDLYQPVYHEQNYSGLSFLPLGAVDALFDRNEDVALYAECDPLGDDGLHDVFADCAALVHSCALVKLWLDSQQRHAVLAFGVREPGRFTPNHSNELLRFLGEVLQIRLDRALSDQGLDLTQA